MEHIKKRLVYYFYGFDDYENNRAIKIHLNCLKYYSYVFDEAIFIVSVDDVENKDLITDIEKKIVGLGFKDIRIKIHKNNGYCEAQPFYDEVFNKLGELDGLTFIAHTKGVSNYKETNTNSIDNWILGMYFLNLQYLTEVEKKMCHDIARFYGAFLQTIGPKTNKYRLVYSGTFYWVNTPMLDNDYKTGELEKINTYFHRGYIEGIPGNSFDWDNGNKLASHNSLLLFPYNEYTDTDDKKLQFLTGDDYDKYCNFKNEMLNF